MNRTSAAAVKQGVPTALPDVGRGCSEVVDIDRDTDGKVAETDWLVRWLGTVSPAALFVLLDKLK